MAFNPSKKADALSSPANLRKNSVNDPGFENQVGYYPYDLSHTEVLASCFGMVTPSMHLITAMGDRHVVKDDTNTILNRINGNFLNTINQYIDSFFISNRTLFPNNWDKLIPNPVKGDDLPHSARPVVPFITYVQSFYADANGQIRLRYFDSETESVEDFTGLSHRAMVSTLYSLANDFNDAKNNLASVNISLGQNAELAYLISQFTFLASILSRGQLLDYLGVQFDFKRTEGYLDSFQYCIDRFFSNYYTLVQTQGISLFDFTPSSVSNLFDFGNFVHLDSNCIKSPSDFRERYMTALERGNMLVPFLSVIDEISFEDGVDGNSSTGDIYLNFFNSFVALIDGLRVIFGSNFVTNSIATVDNEVDFNSKGEYLNISKCLAYQLTIAQHFTNDSVDNIFTSDLYMQLLRSCMYPSVNNISNEPTFDFNGVPIEYDYISYGGFYNSLISSPLQGIFARRYIVGTLLFILRRSLRYGDYFTTGRTRMLSVGQLSVPVDGDMSVNPVDVTLGIITQRFLNAANRVGNKPLAYYASIMGVAPSDMPSIPRYIGHRKIELENRITTNTADSQGAQTTNLVGYSDNIGFDVFIDDYGIILSLNSYDVLPIYNSGIDADNYLSDRFEYFNPMMQNIGDQPIRLSELVGNLGNFGTTFAYTVRNAEYKYKTSKAHGVLCYNLPGFLLKFPTFRFDGINFEDLEHIDPDFIRDKPSLLDSVISHTTGLSPGDYFHFIVSVHNSVKSARLIQRAPGILF